MLSVQITKTPLNPLAATFVAGRRGHSIRRGAQPPRPTTGRTATPTRVPNLKPAAPHFVPGGKGHKTLAAATGAKAPEIVKQATAGKPPRVKSPVIAAVRPTSAAPMAAINQG